MKNNYEKIQDIINNGYNLDFGTTLERAFNNYKKIALIAGLSYLIIGIVISAVALGIIGAVYGFSDLTSKMTEFKVTSFTPIFVILYLIIISVFAGIFAPINAGFYKMAHNAEVGNKFGVETIFEYYKSISFKDLFISALLISFISTGLSTLFEFLDLKFIGGLVSLFIGLSTFFIIPLIIFSGLNASQAISSSIRLFLKNPIVIIGLIIIAVIFMFLGLIGFCIGMLFTLPFINSMYYTIYREIVPMEETSELDEIGSSIE